MARTATRSKRRGASGNVGAFGSAGARPLEIADCPSSYDDDSRREWQELIESSNVSGQPPKLLISDRALAEQWCDLRVRYLAARSRLPAGALVVKGDGETNRNPYFSIFLDLGRQLRLLMPEIGNSPASRPRVHRPAESPAAGKMEPNTPADADPLAGLRVVG